LFPGMPSGPELAATPWSTQDRGHTKTSLRSIGDLIMRPNHRTIKAEELASHDRSTLIFGLAMTAVFVAMLILNAVTY